MPAVRKYSCLVRFFLSSFSKTSFAAICLRMLAFRSRPCLRLTTWSLLKAFACCNKVIAFFSSTSKTTALRCAYVTSRWGFMILVFDAYGSSPWSLLGIFRGLKCRSVRTIGLYAEFVLDGVERPCDLRTSPVRRIPFQLFLSESNREVTGL